MDTLNVFQMMNLSLSIVGVVVLREWEFIKMILLNN